MKLRIKWSNLTNDQRKQVAEYHEEAVREKKIILNQHCYFINPTSGNFMPAKDF